MYKRLVLIAIIALATFVGSFSIDVPRAAEASSGCNAFKGFFPEISVPNFGRAGGEFDAGDTITISTSNVSGVGSHSLIVNGSVVDGPVGLSASLTYTFPATGTYTIEHELTGEGFLDIKWSCGSAAAGCDATVAIPETAVVGRFNSNAQFFWAPSSDAGSNIVIEAGKTYWVDGIDVTGIYRATLLNCTWGWVEIGTVGPNFDEVWDGTPLPNHVVD